MVVSLIVNFVGGKALKNYHHWPWYKKLPFKLADAVVVPTDIFRDLFRLDNLSSKVHKIPHVVDVENCLWTHIVLQLAVEQ